MAVARIIVQIVFMIICVAMAVLILMQEGKNNGLGSLAGGSSDSYWSKNKGRSAEGMLVKVTRILLILFFVVACVLNIGSFQ